MTKTFQISGFRKTYPRPCSGPGIRELAIILNGSPHSSKEKRDFEFDYLVIFN